MSVHVCVCVEQKCYGGSAFGLFQFLQDLLDSLFNILLQNNNSELCDDLVFDALVSDAGTENPKDMQLSPYTTDSIHIHMHRYSIAHPLAQTLVQGLAHLRDGFKELGVTSVYFDPTSPNFVLLPPSLPLPLKSMTFQVYIIALISDRKYHQFRPVLDAYIQTTFSFSMAYKSVTWSRVSVVFPSVATLDTCTTVL